MVRSTSGRNRSPGAAASKHGPRIVGERPRRVSRRSPPYQHQLGQPRSVLDSADLPHGYCWASLPISANCMACERDRSCAAPGDSARPQVRAAAAHGQPARALWSYQQSSALVPTAKVSSLLRRHGERVTAAGDCLAAYFDVDGSRGWSPVVLATAKPPVISVSRKMHRLLGTFGR